MAKITAFNLAFTGLLNTLKPYRGFNVGKLVVYILVSHMFIMSWTFLDVLTKIASSTFLNGFGFCVFMFL